MNYFKYFQLLCEGRVSAICSLRAEVKVTLVRQMEERKKPHKEIYAPFKRGTLTHPNI